jgi:hypothetical protein
MERAPRQPYKGLGFISASAVLAIALWYLLKGPFGVDYSTGLLVFTVCFTFFWQIGWSFGGWPANKWTHSRWTKGIINWVLLMLAVWGTLRLWGWFFGKPFQETDVGLWAQTTIIAGVASLFFFGNQLVLPASMGQKQPFAGAANFVWGVLFLPLALVFMPKLVGMHPLYIPWIWFPIALVWMSYFGGWPFDRVEQPRAGISYLGVVFATTLLFLAILHRAGIDFFATGEAGLKGALFGVTWTNVGIALAFLFNMWPIGHLRQPLKGILGTAGTIAVSLVIYLVLVATFSNLLAVVFGSFAFLWAQVTFVGPGLFGAWTWGYEDNPGGAGIERAGAPSLQARPPVVGQEVEEVL